MLKVRGKLDTSCGTSDTRKGTYITHILVSYVGSSISVDRIGV